MAAESTLLLTTGIAVRYCPKTEMSAEYIQSSISSVRPCTILLKKYIEIIIHSL
jgi:hypothetical protein